MITATDHNQSWLCFVTCLFHGIPNDAGKQMKAFFLTEPSVRAILASWPESNMYWLNEQMQHELNDFLISLCFTILNSAGNHLFKYWEKINRDEQHKEAHREVTNADLRNNLQHKGRGPHTEQWWENRIFNSYSLSKYHPPCAVNEPVEKSN